MQAAAIPSLHPGTRVAASQCIKMFSTKMKSKLIFLLACCCLAQAFHFDPVFAEEDGKSSSTKMASTPGVSKAEYFFVKEETVCHKHNEIKTKTNVDELPEYFDNKLEDTAKIAKDDSNKDPEAEKKRANAPSPKTTEATVTNRLVQPQADPGHPNYVDHSFYKSALVWNKDYFDNYWTNITNGTDRIVIHPTLKNTAFQGYRDFSLKMRLPFEFPFYGHYLENITICTEGYVFTGSTSGYRWFAQEQSIAPLMANFDISLDENSAVVLYEEATRLTIVWENMRIREKKNKFTFAVTIHKNGDIYFAYKDIPIKIQSIDDKNSVFVGLADSYFLNNVASNVRRRSVHNYSRIPFNTYHIKSGSILQLIALPSCPIYNTCKACTGHEAKYGSFRCMWCERLRKCTSGADYFRPYMAECPFSSLCNDSDDENVATLHLSFFHRIFNYTM